MKIRKLNEWKCDMDIDDVGAYPECALKNMVEHFGLKYNPSTESYDCDGSVNIYVYRNDLSNDGREEFDNEFVRNGKMTIRFGKVKGDFILPGDKYDLYELTSLKGCPKTVEGDFNCSCNQLTSLECCPKSVGGSFSCSDNRLTSLDGCPESVGDDFYCGSNQLTSLEGCPKSVEGDFSCRSNRLTILKGCPKKVGGYFDCGFNQLTSLEGCPKTVGGWFDCGNNQLTSLKGCPESVDGDFDCSGNKTEFTEYDVRSVCDVKKKIYA